MRTHQATAQVQPYKRLLAAIIALLTILGSLVLPIVLLTWAFSAAAQPTAASAPATPIAAVTSAMSQSITLSDAFLAIISAAGGAGFWKWVQQREQRQSDNETRLLSAATASASDTTAVLHTLLEQVRKMSEERGALHRDIARLEDELRHAREEISQLRQVLSSIQHINQRSPSQG